MSTTTLPKSIQATQQVTNSTESTSSTIITNVLDSKAPHQQHIKEFIERFRALPDDFLRIPDTYYLPTQNNASRALITRDSAPLVDMIDISVVEAQLVKNYGLLRMDLYCKIRVGHMVCETQTCLNGAKNPKWDGVYQFNLKPGLESFHLEIYDEKQFSLDEKIAWLDATIPAEVFQGITVERWFPLSGRLGTNKEGSVLLVLSHKRVPMRTSSFARHAAAAAAGIPGGPPMTVFVPAANHPITLGGHHTMLPVANAAPINAYIQPAPTTIEGSQNLNFAAQVDPQVGVDTNQQIPISDEDVNRLSEMFPSIDKTIIRAVLENNHNDKEAAIGALLALG